MSQRWALFSILVFTLATGCGAPPDSVSTGTICVPPTSSCPTEAQLRRSQTGRNLLDVALENRGPRATALLDVAIPDGSDALARDAGDVSELDPSPVDGLDVFPVEYDLPRNDRATDRFRSTEISTRPQLRLELDCSACSDCSESCDVRVHYVYMVEPNECAKDDDCPGDRFCEQTSGLCIQCQTDDDCSANQRCERASGRCRPPSPGGCRHTDAPPATPTLGLVFLVLGLLGLRQRPLATTMISLVAVATLCGMPRDGLASPPGSTLTVSIGPRWVTGSLGRNVQRGIGAELHETVRWSHFGISAGIFGNYFVTTQSPPPSIRELQLFGFGVGPRAYYQFGSVELAAGADYRRIGAAPNALTRQTDLDSNFDAVGGSVGVGYRWSRFILRLDGALYPVLSRHGSVASSNLSFGISTR